MTGVIESVCAVYMSEVESKCAFGMCDAHMTGVL